ncbi:BTB/POZ and MATH domain-containing protein 3 [Hondaea fermentalgiana]|uniref:BTB/POZ and MATH domain-containing protein 3 n=1 Tax=Hondaea fermentalgiana TaxID=2315210 RepID=A0A2R5GG99_9STRA|nr:BTB/POZ and MATH domain-containing protein 3 [Hondaea fermentalgiana]|eukprot:GBG29369.1 BTB/POZ and MATH domain-containing protein 3 [Hondaea fermentalgiana]
MSYGANAVRRRLLSGTARRAAAANESLGVSHTGHAARQEAGEAGQLEHKFLRKPCGNEWHRAPVRQLPSVLERTRDAFIEARDHLLPKNYNVSVGPRYIEYVQWSMAAGVVGTTSGVISMQSLLMAVGLGQGAIPTAAALNWILKDGLGQLGGVLFASSVNQRFDAEPKRWRLKAAAILDASILLEVATPWFPQYFLPIASIANIGKNVGWLAASATRANIHRSFMREENLGDITGKAGSQTIASSVIGTGVGITVSSLVGSTTSTLLLTTAALSALHMTLLYKSLQTTDGTGRDAADRGMFSVSAKSRVSVVDQPYSESENVTRAFKGGHRLCIWAFSTRVNGLPQDSVRSSEFKVGDHHWRVECHPAGVRSEVAEYVSLFIRYLGPDDRVTAHWELRCVNKDPDRHKERRWVKNDTHNVFKKNNRWGWDKFMKKSLILEESEGFLHRDDCAIFEAGVMLNSMHKTLAKTELYKHTPPSTVSEDLVRILESGELSDVEFVLEDGTVRQRAHRQILAARSKVFARMFSGLYMEHKPSSEKSSNEIVIPDIDGQVFEELLYFLYSGKLKSDLFKYEREPKEKRKKRRRDGSTKTVENVAVVDADDSSQNHDGEVESGATVEVTASGESSVPLSACFDHFRFVIGLLQAADKYEVSALRATCELYLCKLVDAHSVVDLVMLADMYNAAELKTECLEYMAWHQPITITRRQINSLSKLLLVEIMKMSTADVATHDTQEKGAEPVNHLFVSSFIDFVSPDFDSIVAEYTKDELKLRLALFAASTKGERNELEKRLLGIVRNTRASNTPTSASRGGSSPQQEWRSSKRSSDRRAKRSVSSTNEDSPSPQTARPGDEPHE